MRILITGATGAVGRHLVTQLHDAGHDVRALTRNPHRANLPNSVDVVAGDLSEARTLDDAFHDIEAVHLITFAGDEDLTNGDDIVALAERAGVTRASVLGGWAPTSVEAALQKSRIAWAALHPREFMGNALEWAEEIRTRRTVSMLADHPSAMVHEADIAAVAACVLTEDGHAGKQYPLTGPEALTPEDRTRILAEVTGQQIAFIGLSEDQERERLRGYGYDDEYVEFGIQLATNPPAVAGEVLPTVTEVTGRPARTFAQWGQENADSFRSE